MQNAFYQEILHLIKENSGTGTAHTFSDSYLGNSHPRYPISAPVMRRIGKEWMRCHKTITAVQFTDLLTSLIEGVSSTEKVMAGILMDCATKDQRNVHPKMFDQWLDHLEGWAEVDSLCTGEFTITSIPADWKKWKPVLNKFAKDKNIHKRRASLVLLCSPVRYVRDDEVADVALKNIDRLKHEREVLITKAISWLLRSMVKNFKPAVALYVKQNKESLPKIAVRETLTVLKTGKKTK
jgi:3-methyladenine DNA glycosylase AlkD